MADLSNRVIMITGAGRGIGAATAELLASCGCRLVLVSRTREQLQLVRQNITAKNPQAEVLCLPADITDPIQIAKIVDEVTQHFGLLDALINNAGAIIVKKFETLSMEDWDKMMAINVRAPFALSKACLSLLKKSLHPSILNISSLAGIQSANKFPGFAAYSASKMALVGLSQSMALELKSKKIRVNCLAPGAVDTQMLKEAAPGLKANTKPEDLAREIIYFIDEDLCNSVSGEIKVLTNS